MIDDIRLTYRMRGPKRPQGHGKSIRSPDEGASRPSASGVDVWRSGRAPRCGFASALELPARSDARADGETGLICCAPDHVAPDAVRTCEGTKARRSGSASREGPGEIICFRSVSVAAIVQARPGRVPGENIEGQIGGVCTVTRSRVRVRVRVCRARVSGDGRPRVVCAPQDPNQNICEYR